jgi:hypothetical protein
LKRTDHGEEWNHMLTFVLLGVFRGLQVDVLPIAVVGFSAWQLVGRDPFSSQTEFNGVFHVERALLEVGIDQVHVLFGPRVGVVVGETGRHRANLESLVVIEHQHVV